MIYCPECGARLEDTWKAIQGLHAEIMRLRKINKDMLVWIAALIEVQGGIARIPKALLVSLHDFKLERWQDDLRACEVLRVVEVKPDVD